VASSAVVVVDVVDGLRGGARNGEGKRDGKRGGKHVKTGGNYAK